MPSVIRSYSTIFSSKRLLFKNILTIVPATILACFLNAQKVADPDTPDRSKDENVIVLDTFSVTGSYIRRLEVENALPVTSLDLGTLDIRNAVTPAYTLTILPQIVNIPQNESASAGTGARGDNANVNMRGIGAGNTLILLDGRRLAPHPISVSDERGVPSFAVNVNQLPVRGISKIDVLRDGASSIYGADAIAGVINYITKRSYTGTEVRVRYGMPERRGGAEVSASITNGLSFANGRGNWLTTLNVLYREAIYLRTRPFTASANKINRAPPPYNVPGSRFDDRSSTSILPAYTHVIGTPGNPANLDKSTFRYFRPASPGGLPVLENTSNTRDNYLDSVAYTMGQPRSRRLNWANHIEYRFNNRITGFGDLSYYRALSTIVRQPIPFNFASNADRPAILHVDNPYNPFGSRFYATDGSDNPDGSPRLTGTPGPITLLATTLADVGSEHIDVDSSVYRILGGLRGKIPSSTWTWESAVLYTSAKTVDQSQNEIRETHFDDAVQRTDALAYNPFGYTFKVENDAVVADQPYRNPKAVLDQFVERFTRTGRTSIASFDIRASGEIVKIWSGAITFAAGAEYRYEDYTDKRPPFVGVNPPGSGLPEWDNDFVQASPKPDTVGDRDIYSGYAELSVPLASPANDIPGLHDLALTASLRHERYSDFGSTTKPKVGFNWAPISWIFLRGSYNEGFRAPNLPTLHALSTFVVSSPPGVTDLYRAQIPGEGGTVVRTYRTGNPKLKPEESKGVSAGVVVEMPFAKGLSLSLDFWKIDQNNVVGSDTDGQILANDTALLNAYTQSQIAAGVSADSVDIGLGATYKGDPRVERNPVTQPDRDRFSIWNSTAPTASQYAPAGTVTALSTTYENRASGVISGFDIGLRYNLPPLPAGTFSISTDWTYLIKFQSTPNPGDPVDYLINESGATRVRGNLAINWTKNSWHAGLSAYYIGKYQDTGSNLTSFTGDLPSYMQTGIDSGRRYYRYVVDDTVTFNASVSHTFRSGGAGHKSFLNDVTVRLGVVNLFNTKPPLTSAVPGYDSSVYGNLLVGRMWTLEISKQF